MNNENAETMTTHIPPRVSSTTRILFIYMFEIFILFCVHFNHYNKILRFYSMVVMNNWLYMSLDYL